MSDNTIVVAGIPVLDDDGMPGDYLMECNRCHSIGVIHGDEDDVHDTIIEHMKEAHNVEPEGFGYEQR